LPSTVNNLAFLLPGCARNFESNDDRQVFLPFFIVCASPITDAFLCSADFVQPEHVPGIQHYHSNAASCSVNRIHNNFNLSPAIYFVAVKKWNCAIIRNGNRKRTEVSLFVRCRLLSDMLLSFVQVACFPFTWHNGICSRTYTDYIAYTQLPF